MLFIVTSEQQFFDIGKANYNLDLALFWMTGLKKCWIQFTKLPMSLFTNYLELALCFPSSTIQLCFQPGPVLHIPRHMFSGFVQCETELDQKENKFNRDHMKRTEMLKSTLHGSD